MGKLKDFLKPTKWKILLAIILIIVLLLVNSPLIKCEWIFENYQEYEPPQGIEGFPMGEFGEEEVLHGLQEAKCSMINILIFITMSYVLSCLGIYTYKKYRGKK